MMVRGLGVRKTVGEGIGARCDCASEEGLYLVRKRKSRELPTMSVIKKEPKKIKKLSLSSFPMTKPLLLHNKT